MHPPTLGQLRRARLFLKTTAVLVTVAFLGLYLEPLALAAQLPARTTTPVPAPSDNERLAQTIDTIQDKLGKLEAKSSRHESVAKETNDLKVLRTELEGLDQKNLQDFDAVERHIKDKKLPQVILDRQTKAVQSYKNEMAMLKANLDDLDKAKDDTERKNKAKKAREHLSLKNTKRARPKFDPNDLPNKSLQPNRKNTPKLKKSDYVRAGLISNPTVKLAALGDFQFDKLPGASDPAYLAATAEIVLTDAIKAKALELSYDPVKIYNWVRNNVEWIPTWGATQDADITLGSQRGNAIDIASLLIALYRASGIPARYVHGTIEVPADKFMNWAGGFTDINAAADYASSGGIPVTTIVSGGKITKVQMEHIWVEAAIDFHPSRGAINKSADSWVQLDASYKQYQDLQGLDVVAISGIDPSALAQSFSTSGTVNPTEGWVQNLNPTVLQNAQTQAQTALQTYITNNLPNATVGDVIGGRKIIANNATVLSTGLPYRSVIIGARYGMLPNTLENSMTLAFGTDPLGEPINPITFPWPKLNNHKVTLSFKPATAADEQTLASLYPDPITDLSQLPNSIPAYLISVIPELTVDGQVVGQGNAMRLGEDLNFYYNISRVGGIGNQTYTYPVVAGSYESVMVGGGSVSQHAVQVLNSKLQQTQATLQSDDPIAMSGLTRDDVLGDMLHIGTLGYFGEYISLAGVASFTQKARHNLPVGYGTLGYEPNVQRLFGIPRAIYGGGIEINVRLGWIIHSLDGDLAKRLNIALHMGTLSSELESSVPEQMFNATTTSEQGVSAMKALQVAGQLGQRVYRITPVNQTQILPNLHLDSKAMSDITQALAVGKEVIAHTDRVSISGWTGEGYILFDPLTGDGAYKITGGTNGGHHPLPIIAEVMEVLNLGLKDLGHAAGTPLGKELIHLSERYNVVIQLLALLLDLGLSCADKTYVALVGAGLAVTFIVMTSLIALIPLSGFLLGILLPYILSFVVGYVLNSVKDWAITNNPRCIKS